MVSFKQRTTFHPSILRKEHRSLTKSLLEPFYTFDEQFQIRAVRNFKTDDFSSWILFKVSSCIDNMKQQIIMKFEFGDFITIKLISIFKNGK